MKTVTDKFAWTLSQQRLLNQLKATIAQLRYLQYRFRAGLHGQLVGCTPLA